MYMLSAYKTVVYLALTILAAGVVHNGMASASSLRHLDNYASVQNAQNSGGCKPICQGSPVANKSKVTNVKKDERDPIPPSFGLNGRQPIGLSDNLLTDKQIWKFASWVPPDRLLQSSAYTTSH